MTWVALRAALGDRRRAQSGTTLVELLVSLVIVGLALTLVIGTISTGVLDAVLAKRNVGVQAVLQYEMDQVNATTYGASYSECFATDSQAGPALATTYQGACPSGPYTLRADVSLQSTTGSAQLWTISVSEWPSGADTGHSIQLYADH